jgi:predicted outer membrane lipoprotein
MGRYLLSGLLVLAFGALNALAAENPEKATEGYSRLQHKDGSHVW